MIKDWRGTPIYVGDIVVYPVRRSSAMWMVEGRVVELVPGNPDAESYWDRVPHKVGIERLFDASEAYGGKDGQVEPKRVHVEADNTTVVSPRPQRPRVGP